MKRFTAYRRQISQRDTHNEVQKNPDSEPQFEGVVWTDGTVTLRWLTPIHSTSVWASLEDALAIHGHPEYGTEIVWHDLDLTPREWLAQVKKAEDAELKRGADKVAADRKVEKVLKEGAAGAAVTGTDAGWKPDAASAGWGQSDG